MSADRTELLERYGRAYGELHLAIAFTRSIEGEDAKRLGTGWNRTAPLASGDFGAGLISKRGLFRNPAVVLRPSNLIGLECDTLEGLEQIRALELPRTVTVRSSAVHRLHFWYRPWNGKVPEFVAFRFEKAGITADTGRVLLVPPAVHPSGAVYAFLREPPAIATLPAEKYAELVRRAKKNESELRDQLHSNPHAKIPEGKRQDKLFRYACMQRRWTASRELILTVCLAYNAAMCEPPLTRDQVAHQVEGAMRKQGGQEL